MELTSLRNSCKRRHREMGQLHLFFSFLCRRYLVDSLSLANYYSLHYVKFRETFAHFHQHRTLFFLTMRVTSLLASFLRRNFGTRFLNRENTGDCGNSIFPENSLSIALIQDVRGLTLYRRRIPILIFTSCNLYKEKLSNICEKILPGWSSRPSLGQSESC